MQWWTGRGIDLQTLRAWDGVMAFWVVLWLVVGGWSGYQLYQLTGLADSAVSSGNALATAGRALSSLGHVPVIGGRTAELGGQVSQTAASVVQNGTDAGHSVRTLGVLLGVAIALGPVGPVLLLYLPMRLSRRREVADVTSALARHNADGQVTSMLANRAVANLTLSQLLPVSSNPQGDLSAGRHVDLARAELKRLGLDPRSLR